MTVAEKVDLDEARVEIEQQIQELNVARQRLALDALTDKQVRAKLEDVEARIGDAEVELQRILLARAEQERRVIEARNAERDARQQAALLAARKLQVERQKAAKAIDEAAAGHVAAVANYVNVAREQQIRLREAGLPEAAHVARPLGHAVEAAFALARQDVKWSGLLRGTGIFETALLISPSRMKPLAENDSRPVEPLTTTT